MLRTPIAALAVVAGLLAAAAPASAREDLVFTSVSNLAVTDGSSNTIMFAERPRPAPR